MSIVTVSVVMSVKDGMPFVRMAVNSVLSQSFKDFEFIINDDGSRDNTKDFLNEAALNDKRIKIIRNESPLGLTISLNNCLKHTRGIFIARIDHDDQWLKSKLSTQLEEFKKNKSLVLLGTGYFTKNFDKKENMNSFNIAFEDKQIRDSLYVSNPFLHSSILIKKETLLKVNGYNKTFYYAQDYELWTRVLKYGKSKIIPDKLCIRFYNKNNISFKMERYQRYFALKAKISWCQTNGFRLIVLKPIIKDLVIIVIPSFLKKLIRIALRLNS